MSLMGKIQRARAELPRVAPIPGACAWSVSAVGSIQTALNASQHRTCSTCWRLPSATAPPPPARRLAKVMRELGWTALRVRGLTRGGYLEQVRGYCRDARSGHASVPA
jgi:hypothetical protein